MYDNKENLERKISFSKQLKDAKNRFDTVRITPSTGNILCPTTNFFTMHHLKFITFGLGIEALSNRIVYFIEIIMATQQRRCSCKRSKTRTINFDSQFMA